MKKSLLLIIAFVVIVSVAGQSNHGRWEEGKAWKWYNSRPWICGFNYIPSNAINYTAMWDKTSFSPETIERELSLAETTGFNAVRVVLQYIVWQDDPAYFRDTFTKFLLICRNHGIKVIPALFDDCIFGTNSDPSPGKQPEPFDGWYAWAWSPSPGLSIVSDSTKWKGLENYVNDVIGSNKNNPDILIWDLYNEPADNSLSLVRKVFGWARAANPSQPLTVCVFGSREIQDMVAGNSDVITFHNYLAPEEMEKNINELKKFNRPVICTEWLNRPMGSSVESIIPMLFEKKIGCLHWGLVNGKTQTNLPWGHRPGDGPYRSIWQHDLYTNDLKMYSPYEFVIFRKYISLARIAWDAKEK
jgi:hypothetical protein